MTDAQVSKDQANKAQLLVRQNSEVYIFQVFLGNHVPGAHAITNSLRKTLYISSSHLTIICP